MIRRDLSERPLTEPIHRANTLELVCDNRVSVLYFMTLVQYNVGPAASLEPTVLGGIALISRYTYIERDITVSDGQLEPRSLALLRMESEGSERRNPPVDFLHPKNASW